ncbi:FimV/HubP family polar landmark protein [Bermanella sp. R86510]|uniref:FimV/HubP family polar landmark protein n=1 Tax=unclassified Bermanella TaxID=2627862 RepID=UPI0037CB6384
MLRKLAIAIAASGAMMSAGYVHALGMGDIELESALNQPLDARIKLVKANDLENWEIKPALASDEAFEKAGVERIFFLNNLKFEVEREGGDVYVNIRSQKAVVEPFLNFLVQVDWPSGRLQREYTLLLDPPVFDSEQGIEPVAAPSSQQAAPSASQQPAPQAPVRQQAPAEETLPGTYAEQSEAQSTPQQDTMQAPAKPSAPLVYEVQDNDTLWEVAIRTRANRQISPQQAMLAIQDLNPDAFIDGNINRLKKDQTLEVPTEEQMNARSFEQAVAEVAAQNRAMAQRKAQLDATRKDRARDLSDQELESELRLVAGGDATSEMERGASGQVSQDTLGDQSSLEQELALALEELDRSGRENEELRTRLDSLEEQIGTLQRLINLKDEQMVALQTGMGAEEVEEALDQAGSEQSELGQDETQPMESEQDLNFQDEQSDQSASAEKDAKAEAKPEPKPAPKLPDPEPKPFDPVAFAIENPPIIGGVLGALLLALAGVSWMRKRKEQKSEEDVASDSFSADSDPLANVDMGNDFDDEFSDLELNTDESSLGGEFDGSEDDAFGLPDSLEQSDDTLDVDDIFGQVDLYMSYNRVDSAKGLLDDALAKQPERFDLRLKMLEVLAESDLATEFNEHYDWIKQNAGDAELAKAEHFKNVLEGTASNESDSDLSLDDDFGLGLDMSNDQDNDFTLDDLDLDTDSPAPTSETESNKTESDDLEFDLTDDVPELTPDTDVPVLDDSATTESGEGDNSLDFDTEFELPELTDEASTGSLSSDSSGTEDDDFSLEFDLDSTSKTDSSLETESDLDLDNDLDLESGLELDADSGEVEDVEFSMDELDDGLSLSESDSTSEDDTDFSFDLETDEDKDGDESDFEAELASYAADNEDELSLDLDDESNEGTALDEGFDLDDSFAEVDSTQSEDDSLDLDIPELAPEAEPDMQAAEPQAAEESSLEEADPLADFDMGDDLDNLEGDLDFLSGTDESETKLDLARAYIDMDDKEGAREILEEVVEEGDGEHKQAAQKLLDSLV